MERMLFIVVGEDHDVYYSLFGVCFTTLCTNASSSIENKRGEEGGVARKAILKTEGRTGFI